MSKREPQNPIPSEPEAAPEPVGVPPGVPSVEDAQADLDANPGRDAVLSTEGWVVR